MKAILQLGAEGEPVKQLQSRLAQLGLYSDPVDGVYGAATAQAVATFQQRQGLPVDGVVGPQTWQVLDFSLAPQALIATATLVAPQALSFTPLVVAQPAPPPSPWWLLVMPLIPLVGGGLTYLQHRYQARLSTRRRSRRRPRRRAAKR
ncbi:MAG TPA: peptidoglycan-binding protein [Leptolyngbyaceae cyanobacterium M65_K2018_010]|nr:peptidoglycan-binding protein [Leptolyngbyaceae cyanobacterium M65_K2018_010]